VADVWSLDMYEKIYLVPLYTWILNMSEISRTQLNPKDIDVEISEIKDGIYRISGMVDMYGITFNQFLIDDERPMLIHTGPIGMYKKIETKVKEIIPLQKLAYVSFLHFESDE
jgi:flavorubredoxin